MVVLFQLGSVLAVLSLPALNAQIIDQGIAQGRLDIVWNLGLIMLAACLIQIILTLVAIYSGSKVALSLGADLRESIFVKVQDLTPAQVHQIGAGGLITRGTNDVQQVQMIALMILNMVVMIPLTAIGSVIMALREDFGLSWIIVVSVIGLVILVGSFTLQLLPAFRTWQEKLDQINSVMREQLMGVRVVRAFVREDFESKRFNQFNDAITKISIKVGNLFVALFPSLMAFMGLVTVAVYYFGAKRIDAKQLEVGSMTAFIMYLTFLLMAVMMASFIVLMLPRAIISAERIKKLLVTESRVLFSETSGQALADTYHLEFKDVSLRFEGAEQPVIKQVSFSVPPGSTTAIIGSTGAGKTTLMNLIGRSFDPDSGEITLNSTALKDFSRQDLAKIFALIPQKPYLFSGTIASNLQFGNPSATEEEMWQALEIAQADFVKENPAGLAADIAQGGSNISGGQRQRLAIARALLAKPKIFLFDDSFSALDLGTESRLRAALDVHLTNVSKVIVAQRVSSIIAADQILVLEHGEIVGQGSHAQLLENAVYQEIIRSQMDADELANFGITKPSLDSEVQ